MSRDRAGDERKDEYTRLEAVIEKHQGLIPRVMETQVKSEVSTMICRQKPFAKISAIFCCCFVEPIRLHDPDTPK